MKSLWIIVALLMTGCNYLGKTVVKDAHLAYNKIIDQSTNEEILLNIVRLRYDGTVSFLQLNSITTQFQLTSKSAITPELSSVGKFVKEGTIDLEVDYTEKPTITFIPLSGELFTKQLLTPLDIRTLSLLLYTGWDVNRLLRICTMRINNHTNLPEADYGDEQSFLHVTHLMHELQKHQHLAIGAIKDDKKQVSFVMHIPDNTTNHTTADLKQLLHLQPGHANYTITQNFLDNFQNQVLIIPRSLIGILYYLSHTVKIPHEHALKKVAKSLRASQEQFWNSVSHDFLVINCSKTKPDSSYIAVNYKDYWFYIKDNDKKSKKTFTFLAQLFALKMSKEESVPLLTLSLD